MQLLKHVQPKNDPYIATAETALHAMSMAGNAGAYLVDYIPIREFGGFFIFIWRTKEMTSLSRSEAHPFLVPWRSISTACK